MQGATNLSTYEILARLLIYIYENKWSDLTVIRSCEVPLILEIANGKHAVRNRKNFIIFAAVRRQSLTLTQTVRKSVGYLSCHDDEDAGELFTGYEGRKGN